MGGHPCSTLSPVDRKKESPLAGCLRRDASLDQLASVLVTNGPDDMAALDAHEGGSHAEDRTAPFMYHHLIHSDNRTQPFINPMSLHSAEAYEEIIEAHPPASLSDVQQDARRRAARAPSHEGHFVSRAQQQAKHGQADGDKSTKTQAFIFVIALSLHSFLEGLGMSGIIKKPELISYIIGLCSHKWLEAFALGMTVYNAKYSKKVTFGLNLFYSSLTPLGILFGLLLVGGNVSEHEHALTVLVFNGLSVGSFLFVCCIEMIPPEFITINRHSPYKFFFVVLGFTTMAALAALE